MQNKRKPYLLPAVLFFLLVLAAPFQASAGKYSFSYKMSSDVRLNLLFVNAFRMYFEAQAGVIFNSTADSNGLQFKYSWINGTGWRIRTHRRGSKVSIVTADYSFDRAKSRFLPLFNHFKQVAPFYADLVNRADEKDKIAYRPFKIVTSGPLTMAFKRSKNGRITPGSFNLKMQKPADMSVYNDSFNVYRILHAMLDFYGHDALNGQQPSTLQTGTSWESIALDYTTLLNRIQGLADFKSKKHFSFRQSSPFKLRYRVVSRTADRISIIGLALPGTPVWKGRFKIDQVYRKIILNSNTLEPVEDTVYFDAKSGTQGWEFTASLKKM